MRKVELSDFQNAARNAAGIPPRPQPELPGTEHVPSAQEKGIKPYVIRLKVAQRNYQAAGRKAKEERDALFSAMEIFGIPRDKAGTYNCGDGIVLKIELKEEIECEIPDGMEEWADPTQLPLDGTERQAA